MINIREGKEGERDRERLFGKKTSISFKNQFVNNSYKFSKYFGFNFIKLLGKFESNF